ncbi:MAG TPA: NADH-quinone oxidoreductase subunit M [Tepidisphaeraceae bacterium]|nr:NADH-quinone oxidoreductase subunit M [Tepidisphaeraceae bacterium]
MNYALVILLAVPTLGAVVGAFLKSGAAARAWAFVVSLATLAVALVAIAGGGFDFHAAGVQLPFHGPRADTIGFGFDLGIDSIAAWLVLLTVVLMPLAVVASLGAIKDRQTEYYAWMLALLVAMLGVFVSRDVLLFYVFFELTLIPMFFIIGIWGGPDRRYAAGKFFLFTFAGSVFTLAAAIYLGLAAKSFDIATVVAYAQTQLSETARWWVLLGFLAGFAVKVPLFPVHTWLPLAHTEAPTAGSVILAGVLLKLGTYGLLVLAVPIGLVTTGGGVAFPALVQFLAGLCVVGVIYGALVAWVQPDIKKLVAYSSVSHLGFCVLGLLAMTEIGLQGSIMYMINHGISTGAMFLVIGMIYDRFHTRQMDDLSGLAKVMPVMAFFFVFFVMSSVGLPGTNGFVSEFLTILAAFTSEHLGIAFGATAALGVILGAVYMLHMTARVIFGPLKYPGYAGDGHGDGHGHGGGAHGGHQTPGDVHTTHAVTAHGQADQGQAASADHHHAAATDITGREVAILLPLAVLVLVLGWLPSPVMKSMLGPVQDILNRGLGQQNVTHVEPAPAAADAVAMKD